MTADMRLAPHLSRTGLSVRLLDILETDGGWLTTDGLALRLDAGAAAVKRALYRLRRRGLVENRVVELAGVPRERGVGWYFSDVGARTDYRVEWRFVSWSPR